MKKEEIEILDIKTHGLYSHPSILSKGWENLAYVTIKYNAISIVCNLTRGMCKEKNAPFYFFDLPCYRYKDKKLKWRKFNFLNFTNVEESSKFQDLVFSLVIQMKPQLFREDLVQYNKQKENKK